MVVGGVENVSSVVDVVGHAGAAVAVIVVAVAVLVAYFSLRHCHHHLRGLIAGLSTLHASA